MQLGIIYYFCRLERVLIDRFKMMRHIGSVIGARITAGCATALSAAVLMLCAASCGGGESSRQGGDMPEDALVRVGDSVLTRIDVVRRIPQGLAPADSAELFETLVRDWVDDMLLSDIAAENIDDMDRIERLVDQYRNRLIIESYRRKMREAKATDVSADSLREYYTRHAERLVLERPVVKGLFLKVPSGARRLADIRRWMATATPTAIDNLEKYGLNEAVKYSFFEDRWMDFRTIADQIPYRFFDAGAFVESTRNFETSYGGMTYLLHISEHLPAGSRMPYEVAVPLIRETLEASAGAASERRLMKELYDRALKSGYMVIEDKNNVKIYQK